MEVNNIIISIESRKQAEIVCEILKIEGYSWHDGGSIDNVKFSGENSCYVLFGRLAKNDSIDHAKMVFKKREVVSSVEFVTAIKPDYMIEKINEAHKENSKSFVNRKGLINANVYTRKGIKTSSREEYNSILSAFGDKFKLGKKPVFKKDAYLTFKIKDGVIEFMYINDFDSEIVLTTYDLIKDKIGVDLTGGDDNMLTVEFISSNDKEFVVETEEELTFLLTEMDNLGAKWLSQEPLSTYNYGTDVRYGAYVSSKGDIFMFFSEVEGEGVEVVHVSALMGKKDVKDNDQKEVVEVKEAFVPLKKYTKESSRISALKDVFPGKFDDIEIKGFRFSNLGIRKLREIATELSNDERFKGRFIDDVNEKGKADLSNIIYNFITNVIMGL